MTPTGGRLGELAEIDRRFGVAGAQQHTAVAGDQRKDVTGAREIVGADVWIGECAAAGGALLRGNAGRAAGLVVDRNREGGGVRGIVVRDHRIEPQAARVLGGDRRADDAGGVANDEGHLFRRAERGCDNQIALPFAVVIVGDDDHFAFGERLQNFGNGMGHSSLGWSGLEPLDRPADRR